MAGKLRVVSVTVQVEAVIDDGDHLTPVPIQPARIAAKDWDAWAAQGLAASLEVLEAQLQDPPA
jgi:hypothetical protein